MPVKHEIDDDAILAQITEPLTASQLRSRIWGVARLDCTTDWVRNRLRSLCNEGKLRTSVVRQPPYVVTGVGVHAQRVTVYERSDR